MYRNRQSLNLIYDKTLSFFHMFRHDLHMCRHILSAVTKRVACIAKTKNTRRIVSAVLARGVWNDLLLLASINISQTWNLYSCVSGRSFVERLQRLSRFLFEKLYTLTIPFLNLGSPNKTIATTGAQHLASKSISR
jgi:hypothetical protein